MANLFLNKPVSTGGPGSDNTSPSLAVNGVTTDAWERASAGVGSYLQIDAEAEVELALITLRQDTETMLAYEVIFEGANVATGPYTVIRMLVAEPYRPWQPTTDFARGTWTHYVLDPVPYRYYRIRFSQAGVQFGGTWRVNEIQADTHAGGLLRTYRGLGLCSRLGPYTGGTGSRSPSLVLDDLTDEWGSISPNRYMVPWNPSTTTGFIPFQPNAPINGPDLMYAGNDVPWSHSVIRTLTGSTQPRYFSYFDDAAVAMIPACTTGETGTPQTSYVWGVCQGAAGTNSVWFLTDTTTFNGLNPEGRKHMAHWDGVSAAATRPTNNNLEYYNVGSYAMTVAGQQGLTQGFVNNVMTTWFKPRNIFKIGGTVYIGCKCDFRARTASGGYTRKTDVLAILASGSGEFTGHGDFAGNSVRGIFHYLTDISAYATDLTNNSVAGPPNIGVRQYGGVTVIGLEKESSVTWFDGTTTHTIPEASCDLNWLYTFDGTTLTPIKALDHSQSGETSARSGNFYFHPETDTFYAVEFTTGPNNKDWVNLYSAPAATPGSLSFLSRYEIPKAAAQYVNWSGGTRGLMSSSARLLVIMAGFQTTWGYTWALYDIDNDTWSYATFTSGVYSATAYGEMWRKPVGAY
jgi:hypothetical protein